MNVMMMKHDFEGKSISINILMKNVLLFVLSKVYEKTYKKSIMLIANNYLILLMKTICMHLELKIIST